MKTSNEKHQNNKKQGARTLNDSMVFKARKIWASSECLGPYDVHNASRQTTEYLLKEPPHE